MVPVSFVTTEVRPMRCNTTKLKPADVVAHQGKQITFCVNFTSVKS